MAEIIQDPQLRYTPEQTPIAEMLVQFPGLRAEDPLATLKVIGWGNLAQEIQERYHEGDRVVIEGRLSMNTIEREGFKEKRAELTAQRIHRLGADTHFESYVSTAASKPTPPPQQLNLPVPLLPSLQPPKPRQPLPPHLKSILTIFLFKPDAALGMIPASIFGCSPPCTSPALI